MRLIPLICLGTLLSVGCTALTSETVDDLDSRGRGPKGIKYSLPVGLNLVELWVHPKNAVFELKVHNPEFFADPSHQYYLRYRPHITYNDDINIEIGRKTFIKSIKVTLEDKLPQIILRAIGRIPAAEGIPETGLDQTDPPILIYNDVVNLTDSRRMNLVVNNLNKVVKSFSLRQVENCEEMNATCSEYRRLYSMHQPINLSIQRPGARHPYEPADCTKGICYRPVLPYKVIASVGGGNAKFRGFVELPNESPPILIDIRRSFAVKKVINILFDEESGRLQKVTVKKPSQLYAVAGLPLEIAKAIFTIPTAFVKLRFDLATQQTNLANQMYKLGQAQAKLEAAKQKGFAEFGETEQGEDGGGATPKAPDKTGIVVTAINALHLAAIKNGKTPNEDEPDKDQKPDDSVGN